MQQCNCNQCGTSIEVADGINFVTCRNCQTSLKIHRTEYVVYTEVVENQQNNWQNSVANTQNDVVQEQIRMQTELQIAYQKLNALNDAWKITLVSYESVAEKKVSPVDKKSQYSGDSYALIPFVFIGFVLIVVGALAATKGLKDVGVPLFILGVSFIALTVKYAFSAQKRQQYSSNYHLLKSKYEQEKIAYEQKKAEIEIKIAEIEIRIASR